MEERKGFWTCMKEDNAVCVWISRASKHLIPNVGTILVVALMLFAYRAWAAPAGETPPPVEPAMSPAVIAAAPAANAAPGVISYQGTLTDATGKPVTGNIGMTFRLYTAPTGGAALWTEARTGANAVPVSNGLFNVLLGSLTPIPASVWNNAHVYLGVQVAGDTEMSPREVVSAVGAAMSVQGEQPYYFHGAFATPTQWMADLIYNQNYANFCQAIGKTYTRADVLQHHYTEPGWDSEWSGRGNGFFYHDWYYIGLRYHETDVHVYGNGDPAHPYNVWQYKSGNGCCVASHNWTMEVSVIIWCK